MASPISQSPEEPRNGRGKGDFSLTATAGGSGGVCPTEFDETAWFKRRRFEVTVRTLRGRVKTLSQIIGYFIITKDNLIKWSVAITPTTAMQCGG
jgi:hypothetical protein